MGTCKVCISNFQRDKRIKLALHRNQSQVKSIVFEKAYMLTKCPFKNLKQGFPMSCGFFPQWLKQSVHIDTQSLQQQHVQLITWI